MSESRLVALARQAQNLQPERRTNTLSELRGRWSDYVNPYQTPPQQLSDLANPLRWPAMAVEGIQTAVETVPRMLQPGYDYSDTRQAAEDAFNVAGVVGAGSLLGTAAKPANAVGIFGGRLAKTADQAALAKAEQMAAQGVPREQIWNDTGWFQGVDGKWRFEIDDSASDIRSTMVPMGQSPRRITDTLSDVMTHPEAFSAYESLKTIPTEMRLTATEKSGFYRSAESDAGESIGASAANVDDLRSTGLHETQHAIQDREQFAPGVRMQSLQDYADSLQRAMRYHRDKAEELKFRKMYAAGDSNEVKKIDEEIANALDQYALAKSEYDNQFSLTPYDTYRSYAGEVEARTVEKRRDMTQEQRRARAPWLDYDVPESSQIVGQR